MRHEAGPLELVFAEGDTRALCRSLADCFPEADILVALETFTMPHLLVSDMDSTMIAQECIDELAGFAGLKDKVSLITERAMRGELDFESALRERVALLAGLPERVIAECLEHRITPSEGAKGLLGDLKDAGTRCVLVTGGFHHFADPIAERLGFDRVVGNRLAVENGKLSGELVGAIADGSTKRLVLEEERDSLGEAAVTLVMGDGANDVAMLEAADYAIAYRGKPAAKVAANGYVESGDLRSVSALLAAY